MLDDRLRAAGTTSVFMEIPWAEHAFDAVPFGPSGQLSLYYTERFLAWALTRRSWWHLGIRSARDRARDFARDSHEAPSALRERRSSSIADRSREPFRRASLRSRSSAVARRMVAYARRDRRRTGNREEHARPPARRPVSQRILRRRRERRVGSARARRHRGRAQPGRRHRVLRRASTTPTTATPRRTTGPARSSSSKARASRSKRTSRSTRPSTTRSCGRHSRSATPGTPTG